MEDESSRIRLDQTLGRGQLAAGQSAVKLQEVGPRLSLKLHKVEEGLCTGTVMYHQFGGAGRRGLRGWEGKGWGGVLLMQVGEHT